MNNKSISWNDFWGLRAKIITSIKFLLVIVALDLLISITLSFFLSDAFYFNKYLYDKKNSGGENYQELVDKYYDKNHFVEPNLVAGWTRGPAGSSKGKDSLDIQISTESIEAIDNYENSGGNNLIFLFGSSVLDGYGQDFSDKPAAILSGYGYDTLNFTAANYSIDQSFALSKKILAKYTPKVIVVSLHAETSALTNMFHPFRFHDTSFPFLKPVYELKGGDLFTMLPPVDEQYSKDLPRMLEMLSEYDSHYYKFQRYKRLGLLPISEFFWRLSVKVDNNFYDMEAYIKTVELQKYFMKEFVSLAKKNGAQVIFIKYANRLDLEKSLFKQLLHRHFSSDRNVINNKLLAGSSMEVIFSTQVLKDAGMPVSEFFIDDGSHFTADANRILTQKIHDQIVK